MFCGKKYARRVYHEGFTLVELLIVIVVIGVLSAMMMLSSTEAVSSARASNIISNLRNLKTAALEFYTDNMNASTTDSQGTKLDPNKIADIGTGTPNYLGAVVKSKTSIITKYLGDNGNLSLNQGPDSNNYCAEGGYAVCCAEDGKTWYAIYRFASNETSVKAKITSRAASIGLLGSNEKIGKTVLTAAANTYNNNTYVLQKIMSF